MPIILAKITEGRSREKKQELARALTAETARVLDIDPVKVRVLIEEYSPDLWTVGGVPLSERNKKQ